MIKEVGAFKEKHKAGAYKSTRLASSMIPGDYLADMPQEKRVALFLKENNDEPQEVSNQVWLKGQPAQNQQAMVESSR